MTATNRDLLFALVTCMTAGQRALYRRHLHHGAPAATAAIKAIAGELPTPAVVRLKRRPHLIVRRDRAMQKPPILQNPASLTALMCGDPLPGRSALDRRREVSA